MDQAAIWLPYCGAAPVPGDLLARWNLDPLLLAALALTAVAAPLLAAALPVRRVPGGLALWTGLHTVTFWLWHAPAAYEAALSNHALYWLMQASLLLSALALWRAIGAVPPTGGIAALFATMVQMGLLGVRT